MKRQAIYRALMAGAAALTLMIGGTAYAAQNQGAAPQGPAQGQTAMEPVTDEQLAQFITAATDVQNVQADYAQRMQNTQDQEKAQSLRQEAQDQMIAAVEESGLTVQQFNQIGQRLQTDQELAERLKSIQGDS